MAIPSIIETPGDHLGIDENVGEFTDQDKGSSGSTYEGITPVINSISANISCIQCRKFSFMNITCNTF